MMDDKRVLTVLGSNASLGPIIAAEQRAAWDREHPVITVASGERVTVTQNVQVDRKPKPLRTRAPKADHAERMRERARRRAVDHVNHQPAIIRRRAESRAELSYKTDGYRPHQGPRERERRLWWLGNYDAAEALAVTSHFAKAHRT